MTLPVRGILLTFDRLSLMDLSARRNSMTLNQHYRVIPGWKSITQDVPHHEFCRLHRVVVCGDDQETTDAVCDGECQQITVTYSGFESWLSDLDASLKLHDVIWVHVRNSKAYCTNQIDRVLQQVRTVTADDTLLAVTAFESTPASSTLDFDPLINEWDLRVPAMIEHKDFEANVSQRLTQSTDLLFTLLLHASRTAPETQSDLSLTLEHLDLRKVLDDAGKPDRRNLKLTFGNFRAARSQNFLYAAKVNPEGDERAALQEGLFVKPQDRWNVHDVSNEYLESTDAMRQRLDLK